MTEAEKLSQARETIIGAMGQVFSLYGLPDVVGRIYGLLYLADEPLGLDEIAGELGVSKATVSINARLLEDLHFVNKVWQKGSRRDFYTAQRSFTQAFMEMLKTNLQKELAITGEAIARSGELLAAAAASPEAAVRGKAAFCSRQLAELDRQYKTYGRLSSILGAGEKLWKTITFKKD